MIDYFIQGEKFLSLFLAFFKKAISNFKTDCPNWHFTILYKLNKLPLFNKIACVCQIERKPVRCHLKILSTTLSHQLISLKFKREDIGNNINDQILKYYLNNCTFCLDLCGFFLYIFLFIRDIRANVLLLPLRL